MELTHWRPPDDYARVADNCFRMADAMIAARESK